MNFSVTVLGSGSATPTSRRGLTAQYVMCRNRHILIDCGEGTQMQIRKFKLKFQRIEHVLISHLHGDHYFGLVGLLSTMHLMGRVKEIHIYGPAELDEILKLQLNYNQARLAFNIVFHTIDPARPEVIFEDDKISIENFPLSHRVPTNGFVVREKVGERHLNVRKAESAGVKLAHYHRLKRGEDIQEENHTFLSEDYTTPADPPKSYAFCSDTAYAESILPYIKGVDLLYHEATFVDDHSDRAKKTFHSTAAQAATIAKKAHAGKLIMGHLSARYDSGDTHVKEAREVFENSEMSEDGGVYFV